MEKYTLNDVEKQIIVKSIEFAKGNEKLSEPEKDTADILLVALKKPKRLRRWS